MIMICMLIYCTRVHGLRSCLVDMLLDLPLCDRLDLVVIVRIIGVQVEPVLELLGAQPC